MKVLYSVQKLVTPVLATAAAVAFLAGVCPAQDTSVGMLAPGQGYSTSGALERVKVPNAEASLNAMIFEKTITQEMTEKFNSFDSNYQARQNYQLNDQHDYLRWEAANRDLADWTLRKLVQYHLEHTFWDGVNNAAKQSMARSAIQARARAEKEEKARKQQAALAKKSGKSGAKNSSTAAGAASAAEPLELDGAAAIHTIYSVHKALKMTSLNLFAGAKAKIRADVPHGRLQLGITSPLFNTDVDCRLILPRRTDAQVGEAYQQPERLNLGVNRRLTKFGSFAHANYGLVGDTLNMGFVQPLPANLSAQVDQSKYFRASHRDEIIYRLNFGTTF